MVSSPLLPFGRLATLLFLLSLCLIFLFPWKTLFFMTFRRPCDFLRNLFAKLIYPFVWFVFFG